MSFLIGFLFVIEALVAFLMVAVVMLQPPKDQSGGMGAMMGSGFGEDVFGGRTMNVLSKTTVVLGVSLILNTRLMAFLKSGSAGDEGVLGSVQPAEETGEPIQQ